MKLSLIGAVVAGIMAALSVSAELETCSVGDRTCHEKPGGAFYRCNQNYKRIPCPDHWSCINATDATDVHKTKQTVGVCLPPGAKREDAAPCQDFGKCKDGLVVNGSPGYCSHDGVVNYCQPTHKCEAGNTTISATCQKKDIEDFSSKHKGIV